MSDAQATWFITPEQQAQQQLEAWRASVSVSAFQAQAALTQAGFMPAIEAHLADPDTDPLTVLAWAKAQEFRRMSYTVLEFAGILDISEEQLDDLFRFALTIEA